MKALSRFSLCCLFFGGTISAQNTSSVGCFSPSSSNRPTTFSTYTNPPIIVDNPNSCYRFNCYGNDTITFVYYTNRGGSLRALEMDHGSNAFIPSAWGGPILYSAADNTNVLGWMPTCSFSMVSIPTISGDTLTVDWKMKYSNNPYYDSLYYTYKIHMEGKTLVMRVSSSGINCSGLNCDRSDNTPNYKVVGVPYLTNMTILETNGYYMSFFTDWETSHASAIGSANVGPQSDFNTISAFYAQGTSYNPKSNGVRNALYEKLYFTVSKDIIETFPNLTNPIDIDRDTSANYMIYEDWRGPQQTDPFTAEISNFLGQIKANGTTNIWYLMHSWQVLGYDRNYPNVLPANSVWGGNANLKMVSDTCHSYGYKFSLHENYVDYFKSAQSFNYADVIRRSDGLPQQGYWFVYQYPPGADSSYFLKPSRVASYSNVFSQQINSTLNTDGLFLDVHSAGSPSGLVDYDNSLPNAGRFTTTLNQYRQAAGVMKANHGNGLISGEGRSHLYYMGYYDDFEAQINCGKYNGSDSYYQGFHLPLFVDLKLNKMHVQNPVHGVGYYERFFCSGFHQYPLDSTLMYIATEIAYGNCAFVPDADRSIDIFKVVEMEFKYHYKVQKYFYDQCPVSIQYHDGGNMVSASDFIRNHPATFDDMTSPDFMSQVKVVYSNGVIVYVNRNPFSTWNVSIPNTGMVSYHCNVNTIDSLYFGPNTNSNYLLPITSGWLVYVPANVGLAELNDATLSVSVFPNPLADATSVSITVPSPVDAVLDVYDALGRQVWTEKLRLQSGNNKISWKSGTSASGLYFLRVRAGNNVVTVKALKE